MARSGFGIPATFVGGFHLASYVNNVFLLLADCVENFGFIEVKENAACYAQ